MTKCEHQWTRSGDSVFHFGENYKFKIGSFLQGRTEKSSLAYLASIYAAIIYLQIRYCLKLGMNRSCSLCMATRFAFVRVENFNALYILTEIWQVQKNQEMTSTLSCQKRFQSKYKTRMKCGNFETKVEFCFCLSWNSGAKRTKRLGLFSIKLKHNQHAAGISLACWETERKSCCLPHLWESGERVPT